MNIEVNFANQSWIRHGIFVLKREIQSTGFRLVYTMKRGALRISSFLYPRTMQFFKVDLKVYWKYFKFEFSFECKWGNIISHNWHFHTFPVSLILNSFFVVHPDTLMSSILFLFYSWIIQESPRCRPSWSHIAWDHFIQITKYPKQSRRKCIKKSCAKFWPEKL